MTKEEAIREIEIIKGIIEKKEHIIYMRENIDRLLVVIATLKKTFHGQTKFKDFSQSISVINREWIEYYKGNGDKMKELNIINKFEHTVIDLYKWIDGHPQILSTKNRTKKKYTGSSSSVFPPAPAPKRKQSPKTKEDNVQIRAEVFAAFSILASVAIGAWNHKNEAIQWIAITATIVFSCAALFLLYKKLFSNEK